MILPENFVLRENERKRWTYTTFFSKRYPFVLKFILCTRYIERTNPLYIKFSMPTKHKLVYLVEDSHSGYDLNTY